MPRYALTIEYDGTSFCGWQAQENSPSVQGALEEACFAYCAERVFMVGAGRTDSGVHALGQVAHFDLTTAKPVLEIQGALNFHLRTMEASIAVLEVSEVPDDFHARFSATQRHYLYILINRQADPVLWSHKAWHVRQALDAQKMKRAADVFIGTHDWTTFRAAGCQATSPVKTLDALSIEQKKEQILIRAHARSFLHHQVRSLVGALVEVGRGKLTPPQLKEMLDARDRALCPASAPACGLYLTKIEYEQ